jgi:hypothetical protein
MVPFNDILHGAIAPPKAAEEFLATVQKYASARTERGKLTSPSLGNVK